MQPSVPLLMLSLVQGGLRFLGTPQCPDKAAVEAQLHALDPGALDSAGRHLVMLETRAGGLEMKLFDDGGRQLEDRFLSGPRTCEEWAHLAAAVIAAWETDLAVPPISSPAAVTPPSQVSKAEESAAPKPPADPWRGEVGLGVSGSLASNGTFALGGELLAGLAPPHASFGGELILAGTGFRSLSVGAGSADWERFALGLGGYGALGSGTLRLQLGGAVLFGLLSLRGNGYFQSSTTAVFDPGLGVTARLLWRFAPAWSTWVQLGASFWPKTQEVQVLAGATAYTATIPPVDVSLSLGLSLTGGLD